MKNFRALFVSLVWLLLPLALVAAPAAGRYLKAEAYNVAALIPAAPADDSLTTLADLTVVRAVQARRTPEEVALAAYFVRDSVFQYDAAIGPWFTATNLPFAAEFFEQVRADRFAISTKGKELWARRRPPLLDPTVHAAVELPATGSYPSGHATMAFVWAGLLAEIFSEKREALLARAELVAWSRVVAGVHYPSDIAAGRLLGERLTRDFLAVPEVRAALERVRAEAMTAAARKN